MTMVTEYDWESDSWTQNDDNPARQDWRDAVAEIAEKAKATLPQCNGRVESAVKMVLAGDVELLEGGKAKVASQTNGTTEYFVVNGTCECRDFAKAPSGWCKHRIAAGMKKRAFALATSMLEAGATPPDNSPAAPRAAPVPAPQAPGRRCQRCGVVLNEEERARMTAICTACAVLDAGPTGQAAPAAAGAALPEAAFSLCLKGRLAGQDAQLTVRGQTIEEFQANVAAVRELLDAAPTQGPPPSASTASAPVSPALQAQPQPTPEGWCVPHARHMKLNHGKDGSAWYSHKTADGAWCKGK